MIYDYEIKKIRNEEVLYLYFDFSVEFAGLKKGKNKKVKEEIADFIRKNNISFAGKKVAIVAGGLLMGTLLLNAPKNKTEEISLLNPTSISVLVNEIDEENSKEILEENEEITQVQEQKEKQEQPVLETKKKVVENNIVTDTIKKEAMQATKEVEGNKQYVTVYRKNGSVLKLELEEYVLGVVGAEMPASFDSQALMAQAVLARTYALKSTQNNTRLTDTSSTQNYKSNEELKNLWQGSYATYYQKIQDAVEKTKGMYLTYNNTIIDAVYHSTSNGQTENAENVWQNKVPYLVSVESPYDSLNPSYLKEQFFSYTELSTKLNQTINEETSFTILTYTTGKRIETIQINEEIYNGVVLRNLLGLRSADFEIKKQSTGVIFRTKGYGHGVGMSQYGANGMAKNGFTYEQILKHYYKGVTISYLS